MDAAVQRGHDTVVQFLLSKRTERGTAKAMNEYVARGDLNMVKLLTVDKSTAGSVNIAASCGHLGIVEYFVAEKEVPFAGPGMEAAVKHEHIDVVEYLHSQRPKIFVAKFIQIAQGNNQPVNVQYFDTHRCECCKSIPLDDLLVAKLAKKR
ncbi:Aste57867_31 [Aphanomyces stellatus]|uniref:Aste57867_31 protein n=1 Tax=Aphanomyces stellatus TaxID=120398 RepID=A0A485K4K7_9STRA|nr:hypothetical protein As57867_000031 [Aphanomyces stellatus]VFT77257.1 Aste57867_31 [Aphanomyces stellatus]